MWRLRSSLVGCLAFVAFGLAQEQVHLDFRARSSPVLSSFPPVDVNELNPLTLSWNQVHYLTRELLIDVEDLKREHDLLYKEIQSCYGLEDCLQSFNLLAKEIEMDLEYGANSLMASLQRGREQMTSTHVQNRLDAERREQHRINQYNQNQHQSHRNQYGQQTQYGQQSQYGQGQSSQYGQNQQYGGGYNSSYSWSSSSSSSTHQGHSGGQQQGYGAGNIGGGGWNTNMQGGNRGQSQGQGQSGGSRGHQYSYEYNSGSQPHEQGQQQYNYNYNYRQETVNNDLGRDNRRG